MKKFYSLVLMAAALLIGTNAWAKTIKLGPTSDASADYNTLREAFANAEDGDIILLTGDLTDAAHAWLGETSATDGDARSVTFNLQGHTYINSSKTVSILVSRGKLTIISEDAQGNHVKGEIKNVSQKTDLIRVTGTYEKINVLADGVTPFAELIIADSVYVTNIATGNNAGSAVTVDNMRADATCARIITNNDNANASAYPLTYSCAFFNSKTWGVANGVKVEINGRLTAKKYAFKVNGYVRTGKEYVDANGQPKAEYPGIDGYSPAEYVPAANDGDYSPYVHISKSARLVTNNGGQKEAVAAYAAGYARWLIEGYCEGSTGVYAKSGDVTLDGAHVESNYTEAYSEPQPTSSGVAGAGSGVVIESAGNYSGQTNITIEGETEVKGGTGYAIDEKVTNKTGETKVSGITIAGGTFEEGDQGTITITQTTTGANPGSQTVTITGGTIEAGDNGSTTNIGGQTLQEFLAAQTDNTHAVVVEVDAQGNETVVVSNGVAPTIKNTPIGQDGTAVNWINADDTRDTLVADLTLTELQISQDYNQTLVVPAGKTLSVGRVVMGAKAQIVVKAGGKFVVTGEQGLAAFQESNLVLEASQDAQAIFLFNPAVTSNTHPMATVEFVSKAYRKSDNSLVWQRFGVPSYGALTEITAKAPTAPFADVPTAFAAFDYSSNSWVNLGVIGSTFDYSKMANAFDYYQMANNTSDMGTVVTMKGQLYGNESPVLTVRGNSWNGFANSYMAPINGTQLLQMIPNTVDKAFYLNKIDGDQATWEAVSELNILMGIMEDIKPMQPFLIRNTLAAANATIDYEDAVYSTTLANYAPARHREANSLTCAKVIVKGENHSDYVLVGESDQFTAEFDNGYDAAKYMNDGINMYVSANEKMSIFATDNLENTYIGFQAVKGGNYTIEFANVDGEDLILIDLETGARVAMVEGGVYEFTADANSVNDYRFQITKINKVATDIENTEAVKSVKGIYTITGQYVGEMNVWNTLPAGVYVVDGAKRVK